VQLLLKAGIVVDVAVNITLSFVAKNVRNLKAKGDTVVTEVSRLLDFQRFRGAPDLLLKFQEPGALNTEV